MDHRESPVLKLCVSKEFLWLKEQHFKIFLYHLYLVSAVSLVYSFVAPFLLLFQALWLEFFRTG